MADVCAVGVGRRHADWPGRQGPSVCHCTAGVLQAHLCTADAHVPEHADADSVALVVQRSALGRGSFLANARCAPLALSPLPLIFSYKSEKSLCGAGPYAFLGTGWVGCVPNDGVESAGINQTYDRPAVLDIDYGTPVPPPSTIIILNIFV